MRGLALLALALPLLAAPGAGAAGCGPPAADTVVSGRFTRVYEDRDEVYACTRGVRPRLHLGSTDCYGGSSGCSKLDHAAVAGRVVAFGINSDGGASQLVGFELVVRDVRTGRRLERHTEGFGRTAASLEGIALRQTGAAAWLWRRGSYDGDPGVRVVSRSDRCGAPTTLARAADGDGGASQLVGFELVVRDVRTGRRLERHAAPDTLWRNGTRVFWREGGVDRSAPLC